jgi:hypothetical protein
LGRIYDGRFKRDLGTDGGETFEWEGRIGFIAGVTDLVESHHKIMSALGPRFMRYNFQIDEKDRDAHAAKSQKNSKTKGQVKHVLAEAVLQYMSPRLPPAAELYTPEVSIEHLRMIRTAADFTARARSHVERDNYKRDIEYFSRQPELPPRITDQCTWLYQGAIAIGVYPRYAWAMARKVAQDSIPLVRRQMIDCLLEGKETLSQIRKATFLPDPTARRALEDLECHGITQKLESSPIAGEYGEKWALTEKALQLLDLL